MVGPGAVVGQDRREPEAEMWIWVLRVKPEAGGECGVEIRVRCRREGGAHPEAVRDVPDRGWHRTVLAGRTGTKLVEEAHQGGDAGACHEPAGEMHERGPSRRTPGAELPAPEPLVHRRTGGTKQIQPIARLRRVEGRRLAVETSREGLSFGALRRRVQQVADRGDESGPVGRGIEGRAGPGSGRQGRAGEDRPIGLRCLWHGARGDGTGLRWDLDRRRGGCRVGLTGRGAIPLAGLFQDQPVTFLPRTVGLRETFDLGLTLGPDPSEPDGEVASLDAHVPEFGRRSFGQFVTLHTVPPFRAEIDPVALI